MAARKRKGFRPLTIEEEIEADMWANFVAREEALGDERAAEAIEDEIELLDAIEGVRPRRRRPGPPDEG